MTFPTQCSIGTFIASGTSDFLPNASKLTKTVEQTMTPLNIGTKAKLGSTISVSQTFAPASNVDDSLLPPGDAV